MTDDITIHSAALKWMIALLLGGNTGLLGVLVRFIWKNYRKFKAAIMVGIEEHEKLVQDYIRRHPEERFNYSGRESLPRSNKTRRPSAFSRPSPSSYSQSESKEEFDNSNTDE